MSPESIVFALSMASYIFAFVIFTFSQALQKTGLYRFGRFALLIGGILGATGIILRWSASGHPPLSNMYESLVTLATMTAWIAWLFSLRHPLPLVEGGAAVLSVLMIGIASVFPRDIKPLVPALQSGWLYLHVSIAFVGEACFALAFAMSFLFCFRRLITGRQSQRRSERKADGVHTAWTAERLLCAGIVLGLPLILTLGLAKATVVSVPVVPVTMAVPPESTAVASAALATNNLPATTWEFKPIMLWVTVPVALLTLLLFLSFFLLRGAAGRAVDQWLPEEDRLDEFTYRAIALGFPLFTVGAIIFGMVWAQKAWGRYWGWDPKETWALITFLVYSLYLHLRLTKGWRGLGAAVLSVVGFLVTMFTLFGVNLLLSGLHSYASF
ncbi:MAG TPA: c-type cytochrome biogenesis protein CcsB [Candidatus Ozemobacteraceae bacterium]|mgnify:CR=1 FL=1|nr:c-type cytochrome biogenesis protein CcsB [Candidatus Ozemobacteraceae bacterium]